MRQPASNNVKKNFPKMSPYSVSWRYCPRCGALLRRADISDSWEAYHVCQNPECGLVIQVSGSGYTADDTQFRVPPDEDDDFYGYYVKLR